MRVPFPPRTASHCLQVPDVVRRQVMHKWPVIFIQFRQQPALAPLLTGLVRRGAGVRKPAGAAMTLTQKRPPEEAAFGLFSFSYKGLVTIPGLITMI